MNYVVSCCHVSIFLFVTLCVTMQHQETLADFYPVSSDLVYGASHGPSVADDPFPYVLPTDKRYARLSYYYGRPSSSSSNKNRFPGVHYRYYRSRYYQNYYKPWLNLPDSQCAREKCSSDNDCCRRYSKCDKSAHVCYSCWYGHPCRTSRDCCERYPYCNKHKGNICVT